MNVATRARGLTFEQDTHTYYFEGREVPSVTQVLGDNRLRSDFNGVPAHVLNAARDRGLAAHLATHYHDDGTLDARTVDPIVRPYLEAWKQFLDERRVRIVALEAQYVHSVLGYAGMLDRVAAVDRFHERLTILDIKTGDPWDAGAEFPTAAYADLYRDAVRPTLGTVYERWSVRLHPDGRDVPYTVTAYRESRDWRTFLSALNLTFARAARGRSWRQEAA